MLAGREAATSTIAAAPSPGSNDFSVVNDRAREVMLTPRAPRPQISAHRRLATPDLHDALGDRIRPRSMSVRPPARPPQVLLLLLVSLVLPSRVVAQAEHRVRSGQSLARIAQQHGVRVNSLAAANGLQRTSPLRPGQVLRIPEPGTHYVGQGETLASIARDQSCSVAELQRLNRLGERPLRVGERLILPGYQAAREREEGARQWGRTRTPGTATFYRDATNPQQRIRLVDRRGRVDRHAARRLRELMQPRGTPRNPGGPPPPPRLIEILARVSDYFGGRTITIVSGYRPAGGYTQETSRHIQGHALDLRIQGVPLTALRDYLRANFEEVGVGFYPRTSFVHLDVRDRTTYWVDWSGRGEEPQYQRPGDAPPADATEEEIRSTGMGPGRRRAETQAGPPPDADPQPGSEPNDEPPNAAP
jgi:uncharacterized protein YcbK (DUF882 family)